MTASLTNILAEQCTPDLIAGFLPAHHLSSDAINLDPVSIYFVVCDKDVVWSLSLMQNYKITHQYNGYSISPSAHQLPDGWFAANLLLTTGDAFSADPLSYHFDALDYFDSERQAVGHATAWARGWVDSRG